MGLIAMYYGIEMPAQKFMDLILSGDLKRAGFNIEKEFSDEMAKIVADFRAGNLSHDEAVDELDALEFDFNVEGEYTFDKISLSRDPKSADDFIGVFRPTIDSLNTVIGRRYFERYEPITRRTETKKIVDMRVIRNPISPGLVKVVKRLNEALGTDFAIELIVR